MNDPYHQSKLQCDVCYLTNVFAFSGLSVLSIRVLEDIFKRSVSGLERSVVSSGKMSLRLPLYEYLKRHNLTFHENFFELSSKRFLFASVSDLCARVAFYPWKSIYTNRMWFLNSPLNGLRFAAYEGILVDREDQSLPLLVAGTLYAGFAAQCLAYTIGYPLLCVGQMYNTYGDHTQKPLKMSFLQRMKLIRPIAFSAVHLSNATMFGATMTIYELLRKYLAKLPTTHEEYNLNVKSRK